MDTQQEKEEIFKKHLKAYEKRLVAFIDLQGFKDEIIKNHSSYSIGVVFSIFEYLRKLIKNDEWDLKVTIISDSIVISAKLQTYDDFLYFFYVCSAFAVPKIDDSFVAVRGGIAYGDLHHEDQIVFGPALVDAYDISEGKRKSDLLRIRMSKDTFDFLSNFCESKGILKAIVFPENNNKDFYFFNSWLYYFALKIISADSSDALLRDKCIKNVIGDLYRYYLWRNDNIKLYNKYYYLLIDIIYSAQTIEKIYKSLVPAESVSILDKILSCLNNEKGKREILMDKINQKYRNKLCEAMKCYDNVVDLMKKEIKNDKEIGEYERNPFLVEDWFDKKEIIHKSIVFIFACPGREEFIDNKPCCGQTGDNLEVFIRNLKRDFSDVFQDTDRYSYVILNASDKVHFDELTSNSEPYESEIKTKVDNDLKNKKKIALLENADFIFCFGLKAQNYYKEMKSKSNLKVAPVNCCHLGARGLNNCEELKTYLSDNRISEELSIEDKVKYLYELKKDQIKKMVKH